MKYSNHNNMNNYKVDNQSNYDDLDMSIVDSLSEISVASNLPINAHNQTYLNNTISEVVSLYLWSSDLSSRKNNEIKRSKKSKPYTDVEKLAWEAVDFQSQKQSSKGSTPKRTSNSSKDDKNSFSVPNLDFSGLNIDEIETSNTSNSKKAMSKQNGAYLIKENTQKSFPQKTNYEVQSRTIRNDIESLLKDLKLNKFQNSDVNDYYSHENNEIKLSKVESDKLNTMASNLIDLLGRLLEKRKLAKRNMVVEKMTREEIQAEKIDTQKELLTFEEKHGRPITKMEKDLMRPLYDHYRKVKRLISKPNAKVTVNTSEPVEDIDDEEINNFKDNKHFINLHSFNLSELMKEKDVTLQEKTNLKDKIKNFENDFMKKMGRTLGKEDRELHKDDFDRYKVIKAKIRLIEALIEKFESGRK